MFFLRMKKKDKNGEEVLNGMEIVRLKDKMGTKQLPTAELILDGTEAVLLSEPGKGVSQIVGMLHITRYHNAISSVAMMRRIVNLAFDFAFKRYAFGSYVINKPLHIRTLRLLDLDVKGNLVFVLEFSRLLGLIDTEKATEDDSNVLRVISSLLKLFTAKEGVRVTSEGVECFGGVGVMENSFIPSLLRDAQILPIWEGTTNILSLDILRAAQREPEAVLSLQRYMLDNSKDGPTALVTVIKQLFNFIETTRNPVVLEVNARSIAFNLSRALVCCIINRIKRETINMELNRKEEFLKQDQILLQHWMKRLENEYDELITDDPTFEFKEYIIMQVSKEMGTVLDTRGKLRSKL